MSQHHQRPAAALSLALLLTVGAAALAGPASAHVHVDSADAVAGAEGSLLTFRIPNEKDTATTTKIEVTLPTDTPLAFVRPGAVPGWTATATRVTLDTPLETEFGPVEEVVGSVTWTAAPGTTGIGVGTFQLFSISTGPLPEEPGSLAFPTAQTYSDGETVTWDEPTPEGGEEPEHPAPVLELAAAEQAPAAGTTADASDDGAVPLWLGGAGLVLGLAGAVMGGAALRRSGRPAVGPTGTRTPEDVTV